MTLTFWPWILPDFVLTLALSVAMRPWQDTGPP